MTETEALRQWTSIHSAFVALRSSLGPDFQPLEDLQSETENRAHPFGPPLQFKTFDIAGLWMNYYMGLIHLKRCHPERPPAMMHAARDAAKMTSNDARTMGRIATGLAEDLSEITANDVPICAALIESAFCLFVAGIQVRIEHVCLAPDNFGSHFTVPQKVSARVAAETHERHYTHHRLAISSPDRKWLRVCMADELLDRRRARPQSVGPQPGGGQHLANAAQVGSGNPGGARSGAPSAGRADPSRPKRPGAS